MIPWLNKKVGSLFRKKFQPKAFRVIDNDTLLLFKDKGEGLFYSNIKSVSSGNFMSGAIGRISEWLNKKGAEDIPLSHTIAILYSENIRSWFSDEEWAIVKNNWNRYYGGAKELDNNEHVIVLASADSDGMNFCSFSNYQYRDFSLRKLPLSPYELQKIVRKLVQIEPATYDFTGLFFLPLYRIIKFFSFFDDSMSIFCSELYDTVKEETGFLIANVEEPTPLDIENAQLDLRFYVTPNFLT